MDCIIAEDRLEKVGINIVAQKAGISKMLIYRYFGNINDLMIRYILKKDYWINISTRKLKIDNVNRFLKIYFAMKLLSCDMM